MVPVYWFLTYAGGRATLPLAAHPVQESMFVDCAQDPAGDPIAGFGVMGFGTSGENPCPGEGFTLQGTWGGIEAAGE